MFLQGPHGPFFGQLARSLTASGARVIRVGFNSGDRVFWPRRTEYIPWRRSAGDWKVAVPELLRHHGVTDLVLYGDTRPIHADAVAAAKTAGLCVHVFEEGYLRPWWISYERDGSNGNSALMDLSPHDILADQGTETQRQPAPPCHWGDMRQHIFYGAVYHWLVMFANQTYAGFRPHRSLPVSRECRLFAKRFFLMPLHGLQRRLATWRIRRGGFAYHTVLLQLEHDSSFLAHSPYRRQFQYLREVVDGFAHGAPRHHHLVFKAHPLEDGRAPLRRDIDRLARARGIRNRVHFVNGGKLGPLLDEARSAVTVNSTAGHQALWRGLPLHLSGTAIYDKPGLVSRIPLARFFAEQPAPDRALYAAFRSFLLNSSQLPGSYYAAGGRRQLLRRLPDLMLSRTGPYARTAPKSAAHPQQFRVVNSA
ncbi:capsule biosynthesis protein CapA [uncultured Roseobacter sp.]|uniref:capsule biosynthesis protein n=1 Tax=uncultured Roseobacter sp. TaxID=114847 RepID=UPI00260F59E6|nr:capsule biosynthesis protein CapA [uncultured Roseobacter sp.]